MPSYVTPKKNTAFIFYIGLTQQADTRLLKANPTLAAADFNVSTDGGALGALATTPTVTPASGRMVKISLSSGEMNGDNITVVCSDSAGAEWCDQIINIQTSARQVDDLAYPATSGRSINVSAGGVVDADMTAISTDSTAANNLETMLDGTGGQALSLGQLNVVAGDGLDAVTFQGGNASGATPAGYGLVATGGNASSTSGGSSGFGISAFGGDGAATNNSAGVGFYVVGGVDGGAGGNSGFYGVGTGSDNGMTLVGAGNGLRIAALGTGAGINITGGTTSGDGISISATSGNGISATGGTNGAGIVATGAGTGTGLKAVGGTSGRGCEMLGGATTGQGLSCSSQGTHAVTFSSAASGSHGLFSEGNGAGHGIFGQGGTGGGGIVGAGNNQTLTTIAGIAGTSNNGNGIEGTSTGGNGSGLLISGNGTGSGIKSTGGATGHGLETIGGATSGNGIKATGTAGNSAAMNLVGQGSGHGLLTTGGATGHGLSAVGGATSGNGIKITGTAGNSAALNLVGQGSAAGLLSTGGATGHGISATGGATSGEGILATGIGTGAGLKAVMGGTGTFDIIGSLGGPLNTVTTLTNLPSIPANWLTAAGLDTSAVNEIADGVWDEAIAGHLGAGSTGAALNAAGAAGDPWTTPLPGAYGAGTAGFIVGTNLDTPVSSRSDFNSAIDDVIVGANNDKLGYSLSNPQAFNLTGNITGSLSGSVGSVSGSVGGSVDGSIGGNLGGNVVGDVQGNVLGSVDSVVNPVTVGTNNDKTGYSIGTGGISSTSFAANAIDAAALDPSASNEIADAILARDLQGGSSSTDRNVRNALRPSRNRVVIATGGGVTVYEEDDVTPAWTGTATRDAAAEPITEILPA